MKVTFPTGNRARHINVPNLLIVNRISFGIVKLFLITKHPVFWGLKYKQFKPFFKRIKDYKNYEIVSVKTRQGEDVRIFL